MFSLVFQSQEIKNFKASFSSSGNVKAVYHAEYSINTFEFTTSIGNGFIKLIFFNPSFIKS